MPAMDLFTTGIQWLLMTCGYVGQSARLIGDIRVLKNCHAMNNYPHSEKSQGIYSKWDWEATQ
jgi:hypothetical protein